MLLSRTPPVARWYRWKASIPRISSERRFVAGKRTGSNQSESGASVNDTSGGGENGGRRTIANGLVYAPELRGGGGRGERTIIELKSQQKFEWNKRTHM